MGGNSSKQVKTKYEVRHTVDGQLVTTISQKGSIKKRNKNSVKIKEKKGLKKSKSVKGQQAHGANLSVIEETSDTAAEPNLSSCPVYRKKSSCPSCEARDILLGKNRSRSGSEKSLRFSDFNKVLRRTRIYDWELEPVNIPLYGVEEPIPDDICYICEVYTGSHVRACRVCYRAYHDSCLTKIGHPLSEASRILLAADKWSCHQCVSLNHLLTQEEVKSVLNELEDLDIAKDEITEASYLRYCRHCLEADNKIVAADAEDQMVQRFRSVGQVKPGVISFTQFLNIETVRVLSKRCKDSLVHLLTQAELAEARKMFLKVDSGRTALTGKCTMGTGRTAFSAKPAGDLGRIALTAKSDVNSGRTALTAMSAVESGKTALAAISAVDSAPQVRQPYRESPQLDESLLYIDEDMESTAMWPAFLRDIALDLIRRRCNTLQVSSIASVPDDTEDATLTFSSCDSLGVDEERYSTCNSELEPHMEQSGTSVSVCLEGRQDTNNRFSQSASRSTMLDDIQAHIDRSHRHENLCGRPVQSAASSGPVEESSNLVSDTNPQITAEVTAQHMSSHPSSRDLAQATSLHTGRQWADLKASPERARSSPYNDSYQVIIPWGDAGKKFTRKENHHRGNTKPAYRKSEVIPRPAVTSSGQSRAVSQAGCEYVQAPICGVLADRLNNEQWKC